MEVAATAALSGLEQAQTRIDSAARRIADPGSPVDSLDLSTEAVALIQSRNDFAAKIGVLRTIDQLQKNLFDLVG